MNNSSYHKTCAPLLTLAAAATLALCCACVDEIEPYGTLDEPQPLVFTAEQTIGGDCLKKV